MEFRASHRNAGITPRKTRYVVDLIRGQDVNRAFEILDFTRKRGCVFVRKVLASAVANASQAAGVNVNRLYVREARVDGGRVIPGRPMPAPMGRALPVRLRHCHIHLVLAEREEPAKAPKAANKAPAAKAPKKQAAGKGKK